MIRFDYVYKKRVIPGEKLPPFSPYLLFQQYVLHKGLLFQVYRHLEVSSIYSPRKLKKKKIRVSRVCIFKITQAPLCGVKWCQLTHQLLLHKFCFSLCFLSVVVVLFFFLQNVLITDPKRPGRNKQDTCRIPER